MQFITQFKAAKVLPEIAAHNTYTARYDDSRDIPLPQHSLVRGVYIEDYDYIELICDDVVISSVSRRTAAQLFNNRIHPIFTKGLLTGASSFVIRIHATRPYLVHYKYARVSFEKDLALRFIQIAPTINIREQLMDYKEAHPHLFLNVKAPDVLCHNILIYTRGKCKLAYM